VSELFRLLRYARPYAVPLLGSVVLMAIILVITLIQFRVLRSRWEY